jgi:hypothetical protein
VAVAAVSKDANAITVTTPVRRGRWCGRNDGKDASNRGNATGNNQPVQQKDERADKRSGSEDATRGDRRSRDCSLWRATYLLEAAVRSGILETTYRVVLRGSGSGGGCRGDATTDDVRRCCGRCPTLSTRRVNRRALLRHWEANNAAPLRRQLLRHHEPDAAQGKEARCACATWPGPPGSNRSQQSNLGQRGGCGEILLHATIKLRTTWRTWRDTAAIAP